MIKQILDESDHKTHWTDISDGEEDYLSRALSLSSHSSSYVPGGSKRGSASPQISDRKDARRTTTTPTPITRKKSMVSSSATDALTQEAQPLRRRLSSRGDAYNYSISSQHSATSSDRNSSSQHQRTTEATPLRRHLSSRGDAYNYGINSSSQHSTTSSDRDISSQHQRVPTSASTTPRLRRRKSTRGDMPNDVFSARSRSVSKEPHTTVPTPPPPPPPPSDSSMEMSRSTRKGRRRSCRGDSVMDTIQAAIDDTSESLNSMSLVSAGSLNSSELSSSFRPCDTAQKTSLNSKNNAIPRQIVERRRSCRGDLAMDLYGLATEPQLVDNSSSTRSARTVDQSFGGSSKPRRSSSFGILSGAASTKFTRRNTASHAPSHVPQTNASWSSAVPATAAAAPVTRRRLSLGLRRKSVVNADADNTAASQTTEELASLSSSSRSATKKKNRSLTKPKGIEL